MIGSTCKSSLEKKSRVGVLYEWVSLILTIRIYASPNFPISQLRQDQVSGE